jgi:large subunit ribosomal protein L4
VAELAWRRAGTHSTRTRAEARGGGVKPWRQKGTGRARQGSIRAPQWTGGGVVFGPTPRSHGGKVNRKVRAQAFRAALRAHAERGSLALMDETGWDAPATRRAAEYLRQAPDGLAGRPLLVVVEDLDSVEARSFRNLAGVGLVDAASLETVDVVGARSLLVQRSAWERLAGGIADVEAVEGRPKPPPAKATPPPESKLVAEPAEEQEEEAEEAVEPAAEVDEEPDAEAAEEEDAPEEQEEPAGEEGEPEDGEPEAEAAEEVRS